MSQNVDMGTPFEEIEVRDDLATAEIRLSHAQLDRVVYAHDQWFEPFAFGSGGSRLVPGVGLLPFAVPLVPYSFRGVAASTEHDFLRPICVDTDYLLRLGVVEKYERREKQHVWFQAVLLDKDAEVYRYRWLQVLSFVKMSEMAKRVRPAKVLADYEVEQLEQYPYEPPPFAERLEKDWQQPDDRPPYLGGYIEASAPLGTLLQPEGMQFSWRRSRDHAEICRVQIAGHSRQTAAYSIHTNDEAAKDIGLPHANISAGLLDPYISNLMMRALGCGWIAGGRLSTRFLKPVALTDFVSIRGRLVGKQLESDGVRMTFDVWAENQRGERVFTAVASGLAAENDD